MLNELIRINMVIILAFLAYRLVLSQKTTLVFRRFFLLGTLVIIPAVMWLTDVTTQDKTIRSVMLPEITLEKARNETRAQTGNIWTIQNIYFAGMALAAFIFLVKSGALLYRFSRGKFRRSGKYFMHAGNENTAPCSFFRWIVLPAVSTESYRAYEKHEKAHADQWHSLDILLFEIIRILFWFNPVLFLVRREMITVHEGLADRAACEDTEQYSRLIVENSFYTRSLSLDHSFIQSFHIKRRLMMLQEKQTIRQTLLRAMIIIPLLACGMYLDVAAQNTKQQGNTPVTTETMPEFPGGNDKFNLFIMNNLQYPQVAKESGTQGRVMISFTVTASGKVTNVKVLKSLSKETDAEAVRVISMSPDWKPGTKNGTATDMEMTLPINFRLD